MLFYLCPWVYPDAGRTSAWELWRSGRSQSHPELFRSFQQHVSKETWCLPIKKQQHLSLICLLLYSLHSFIHSNGMCRMWQFLAVLRSFLHSSLLYPLSFHPFPPTSLPSYLISSCHLFLGLPLSLVVSKFTYNTLLGILLSSNLRICSNQCNLFNLIVSVMLSPSIF